jgi:hypothetical protein
MGITGKAKSRSQTTQPNSPTVSDNIREASMGQEPTHQEMNRIDS